MKKNTRQRSYPRPDTPEKNKQLANQKDMLKRTKCRAKSSDDSACKNCSMSELCASEATQGWLNTAIEKNTLQS